MSGDLLEPVEDPAVPAETEEPREQEPDLMLAAFLRYREKARKRTGREGVGA